MRIVGRRGLGYVGCMAFILGILGTIDVWAGSTGQVFYVSTNGNDAWSGRLPVPGTSPEGPWATLTGARDALRRLRGAGELNGPVSVQIRGGHYPVEEAIVFTAEDSGTRSGPIRYEAYPGETPVFDGGRVITGWRQEGALWVTEISEVQQGKWDFSALWVNGERRQPARTPNASHRAGDYPGEEDFFYTAGPVVEKDGVSGAESKSARRFQYRAGDLQAWASLPEARVVVFHSWETSLLRVESLDEANRIVSFTGAAAWPFAYWRPDQWYFVENLYEGLDQPGEWFLDRRAGKLFYMPMPGEVLGGVEMVVPVAKQLLLLNGNAAGGQFVEHLAFRGLGFMHSEYTIEAQGHSDGQAAASVPAAVQATGARFCTFDRCVIGHVGTYGVWFRAGCQDNRLSQCEVFDLGAGAVRLGESGDAASENEVAQRNVVENCFLHDGGLIFRGAVGVWIGRSSYNTVSHNEVCDFRYSGMSVGWSWGYDASSAHDNRIEYNHIHDVGKGQLSDMGGIYTLGVSPGTVLRNNYIHDVLSNPKVSGGWGLYTDEGSTDILIENNIVHNTLTGTFHQHYGKENRVINNILAFSHREQLIRSRQEEHLSFFFERNIVYFNNGRLLGSNWTNGNWRSDYNCYWDTSDQGFDFAGRTFAQWQSEGFDTHSLVADPGFVDIEGRDFRLKPESPVYSLGFKPINMREIGLYGDPKWTGKPGLIVRDPYALPAPPAPFSLMDDFEETPAGDKAVTAQTLGEEGAATVRVSEEAAVSGGKSLKFTDGPGLSQAFNPHLVYAPHLLGGIAEASFSVRLGKGCSFFHEWRDGSTPYRVGPSVWFYGDGRIEANGRVIAEVSPDQWVNVVIQSGLGKYANGHWKLCLSWPGSAPVVEEELVCGTPEFSRLDWFGFVSNATDTAVTYLDALRLDSVKR